MDELEAVPHVIELCPPSDASFDLIVIGCGGGPLETNLSSYLVKPVKQTWQQGATLLEGGSTLGAIARLVESHPTTFHDFDIDNVNLNAIGGARAAGKVWSCISCYAVSHAHLDHCLGLIVSSGASLQARPLYGSRRTIENLERVMDGGPWPKLAGKEDDGITKGRAYLYRLLEFSDTAQPLSTGLDMKAMPVAHGMDPSLFKKKLEHTDESYSSTAFFIRSIPNGQHFLFFGDVEADSISKSDLNRRTWERAADLIVQDKLRVIFIECSYPTSQPKEQLWGHLSPQYVIEELQALASLVKMRRGARENEPPLSGITIVITHIKDDIFEPTPLADQDKASKAASSSKTKPPPTDLVLSPPAPSADPAFASRRTSFPDAGHPPARRLSPAFRNAVFVDRRKSVPALMHSSFSPHRRRLFANDSPSAVSPRSLNPNTASFAPAPLSPLSVPSPTDSRPSTSERASLDVHRGLEQATMSQQQLAHHLESAFTLKPPPPVKHQATYEDVRQGDTTPDVDLVESIHERIERELNELSHSSLLGVEFLIAAPGMRLVF